jgi:hypothetical protein
VTFHAKRWVPLVIVGFTYAYVAVLLFDNEPPSPLKWGYVAALTLTFTYLCWNGSLPPFRGKHNGAR